MARVDKKQRKVAKLAPLKLTIPARLRPHIRASFACHLGYGERDAVIYLLQNALHEEIVKRLPEKLDATMKMLKSED